MADGQSYNLFQAMTGGNNDNQDEIRSIWGNDTLRAMAGHDDLRDGGGGDLYDGVRQCPADPDRRIGLDQGRAGRRSVHLYRALWDRRGRGIQCLRGQSPDAGPRHRNGQPAIGRRANGLAIATSRGTVILQGQQAEEIQANWFIF